MSETAFSLGKVLIRYLLVESRGREQNRNLTFLKPLAKTGSPDTGGG